MSALTLLAFLFFLHILQQCIKDHMTEMSTPPVVVMTAGREGEDSISSSYQTAKYDKIDKAGSTTIKSKNMPDEKRLKQSKINDKHEDIEMSDPNKFMKIKPVSKPDEQKYKYAFKNDGGHPNFAGFVNAMNEE